MTPEAERRAAEQGVLEDSIDGFLAHLGGIRNLAENTRRAYRGDLVAFLDWTRREGVAPLSITHRDLRAYLSELARAGYSSRTVARHLSALRGLYRWMLREGRCASAAVAALSSPKLARTLPRTMSDEDAGRLLATCGERARSTCAIGRFSSCSTRRARASRRRRG